MRSPCGLTAVAWFLTLTATLNGAAGDERALRASRSDQPPRKVLIGTCIFGPYQNQFDSWRRFNEIAAVVACVAKEAEQRFPGRRLDLIVLPENALNSAAGPAIERARPLEEIAREYAPLARQYGCYLVAPTDLLETRGQQNFCTNAAILFDRAGSIAGVYRKVHPVAVSGTDSLENGITPGVEFPVFDCDFGKLGIQICWDVQYYAGWNLLADRGAEIVAWPSASPATVLPAAHAARNRYYVVGSNWRDNASIYDPAGMVAARIEGNAGALVHEIDLSFALLSWAPHLQNGAVFDSKFGDRAGHRYSEREDVGLFWSNDPNTPIGNMVRQLGLEEIDNQIGRNADLRTKTLGDRVSH